jgi:hypothetical protein
MPFAAAWAYRFAQGTINVCYRCDIRTRDPECWICGDRLSKQTLNDVCHGSPGTYTYFADEDIQP